MTWLRRLTGVQRVWALTAAILPLTVLMSVVAFRFDAPTSPYPLPEPLQLGMLFFVFVYLGEIAVVHIRFRRDAHSFSMSELPLIAGLAFLPGGTIVLLGLLANVLALAINRRQQLVKLGFNLVQLTLQTATMVTVFHLIVGGADPIGLRSWVATVAAISASSLISVIVIGAAIDLGGGSLDRSERVTMSLLSIATSTMNGALGLVAATILWTRPINAWMTLLSPAILYICYRAYLVQRVEADRLRALYDVSGELHRLPRVGDALIAATEHARSMLDVEMAAVYLLPNGPDDGALLTLTRGEGDPVVMAERGDIPDSLRGIVETGTSRILVETSQGRDVAVGVAVAIPDGKGGSAGIFTASGPLSAIGSFGNAETRLLETLAQHVGVSLENGRLEDSVARLNDLKERLRHQALHDGLTGIANRTLFMERLEEACASGGPAAVLFLDLDEFKSVNDGYGHDVGDSLLVSVARRLEACSRPDDVVARLGGDEFAILLPQLRTTEDAVSVAQRIVDAFERPFPLRKLVIRTRASIGISVIDGSAVADTVLRAADEAMYLAKHETKGGFRLYRPDSQPEVTTEADEVRALTIAIAEDQLELHYQPVVDLVSGWVVGVEALVRWNHPVRGFLGPDRFIPLAERNGLSARLAEWVIHEATRSVASWRTGPGAGDHDADLAQRGFFDRPWLAVNLSAADVGDKNLSSAILDILARNAFEPSRLVVEITESSILDGGRGMLDELRDAGAKVALDDFGTGYSSLATLDQLPVDVLKLDRSFLDHLNNPRKTKLLELILQAGGSMGFTTVAEGIETNDQLEVVVELGATYGQGYLLGRPQPTDAARDLVQRAVIPTAVRRPELRLVTG